MHFTTLSEDFQKLKTFNSSGRSKDRPVWQSRWGELWHGSFRQVRSWRGSAAEVSYVVICRVKQRCVISGHGSQGEFSQGNARHVMLWQLWLVRSRQAQFWWGRAVEVRFVKARQCKVSFGSHGWLCPGKVVRVCRG